MQATPYNLLRLPSRGLRMRPSPRQAVAVCRVGPCSRTGGRDGTFLDHLGREERHRGAGMSRIALVAGT